MRSTSYWNKRMQILEQSRYDGNVQSFYEIERIYRKQLAEMQKEINAWYGRFAQNNEISLADARKLLDDKQLDELKWNVQDYIKYGRENALDPKWIKQLENASARYHISRLEALQLQLQQRAESVMAGELDVVDARVRDVYQTNYYHTAFEIQRGIGVGWDLERLDDRRIDKVISKPWAVDGKNFSERIWEQRDKLVNTLHQELTQSIIRGESPERAIKALADRMEVSKSNARRLIMTESAAIASAAQQECYNELDVEQYKIVATLDDVTCDICAGLDGSIFKMSEYSVGTTAPPFHPNCRTVTVPYFADDNSSKRAARGADGKTYLVPADTKFTDWKKAFIDGEEKPFKVDPDWKLKEPEKTVNVPLFVFNEAKTLEESENYAKNFALNVDYKGLSLKNANKINEELTILMNKYDVQKWDKIHVERGNFAFTANYNSLSINPQKLGKALENDYDAFLKQQEEKRNRIQIIRERFNGKRIPPAIQENLDKLENELKFKRFGVLDKYDDKIKVTLTHEFGHTISDQVFGMINQERANPEWKTNPELRETKERFQKIFEKAIKNGDIYNISEYSRRNVNEFFSECFAAREMGEKLPDYIEDAMVDVLKKVERKGINPIQQQKSKPKEKTMSKIDECKTIEDVENLIKSEDWFIHMKMGNNPNWRSDDNLNLRELPLEHAKMLYTAYDDVFKQYPQFKNRLAAPSAFAFKAPNTYADTLGVVGQGGAGISLNTDKMLFANVESLKKKCVRDVEEGFHPKGTSVIGIIYHEIGHQIDFELSIGKNKLISNELQRIVLKNAKSKIANIERDLSGYATKSKQEFFAECFNEIMESENPRDIAKEFGKALDELLKEPLKEWSL